MRRNHMLLKLLLMGCAIWLGLSTAALPYSALSPALAAQRDEPQRSVTRRSEWRAVVQLGAIILITDKKGKKQPTYLGVGSGTIVSRDGLILTNYHVVNPEYLKRELGPRRDIEIVENKMVVLFTRQVDQPPVTTYIADLVDALPKLDLAVLRISSDLSGEEIDPATLNLPFIELGDSDTVEIEDVLRIYGYPGIGGQTITFTRGSVSGFDSEPGVKGRAWIKTDATVAGGNSGGAALNEAGQLVGVPTLASVASAEQPTDCRHVQDTNNDGDVNDFDTCIPIGGFINALRPVNLAKDMIARALREQTPNQDEPRSSAGSVQIVGQIVDADTGKPIPGAVFTVLKAGLSWDDFDGDEADVLESVRADRRGRFETSPILERGKTYSIGWGARGYREMKDNVTITADMPDVLETKLKLQRK
jgi:S1-C subfamily serine protease